MGLEVNFDDESWCFFFLNPDFFLITREEIGWWSKNNIVFLSVVDEWLTPMRTIVTAADGGDNELYSVCSVKEEEEAEEVFGRE